MKLPLAEVRERLFERGALLKIKFQGVQGPRDKFALILNVDEDADPILLVLSTTKLKWYIEHLDAKGFLLIEKGTVGSLTERSVINCRKIESITRDDLERQYEDEVLRFCEVVPAEFLAQIDAVLENADTLSPAQKRAVVPGYRPAPPHASDCGGVKKSKK